MTLRAAVALPAFAIALLLSACAAHSSGPTTSATPNQTTTSEPSASPLAISAPPSPSAAKARQLEHVVIIVEENKPATSILGNPAAPYLNALARRYASASRYSAVAHPSLPNYLALTSGSTAGITSDCNPPGGACLDTGPNIAQSMDRTRRSWRMYAESMPTPCSTANTNLYAVKHNPFLYFPSVTADPAYCASHVVPFSRLARDLTTATSLPNYVFVSPNLCNDMHDCSVATGDAWLAATVPGILRSPAFEYQHSLLVIAFDEGDDSDNRVACVFAGPASGLHTVSSVPYTHYSLLRTIESAFGLPPLTANDADARTMTPMLR